MSEQPEIVCICGSMRFADDLRRAHRDLTLSGLIALMSTRSEIAYAHATDTPVSFTDPL